MTRRPSAIALCVAVVAGFTLVGGVGTAQAGPRDGLHLSGADSTLLQERTVDIAPGLDVTSFQRLQPGGWVTGHVMTADLSTPSLSLDVEDGGTVSGSNATVSEFAADSDAVAAVNGDYFDMNASDAPIGTNVSSTQGLRTAGAEGRQAFTLANGKAAVQELMSGATAELAGRTEQVASVNSPTVAEDSIALFNEVWGAHPIHRVMPAGDVRVVTVVDGEVTANTTDRATIEKGAAVPAGTSVLVAHGTAGDRLADAEVGSDLELTVEANEDVDLAVGGAQRLLTDGELTEEDQVTAARTAIGVSKDGTDLHVVTVDGRQADAHGMTIQELARLMQDLGAWNAVNLDGGGSTTLVGRPAGTTSAQVINRPSDGKERLDANALVFRSTAKGPKVRGIDLQPEVEPAVGLTEPNTYDILPGLSRTLHGVGLDPNLAATEVSGRFGARGSALRMTSRGEDTAVVEGRRTGKGTVSFRSGRHHEKVNLHVHGPMERLEPSESVIALPDTETSASVTLDAVDGDGNRMQVEPLNVAIEPGPDLEVTAGEDGSFTVTPTGDQDGASEVSFTVQGRTVRVPVTIGFEEQELSDFSDVDAWEAQTARATGTIAAGEGPEGGSALALDFDFSTSTATRGMYAVPREPITIEGQPQALSLWIKGTGKGEWPRLQVDVGDGTTTNLDGPEIEWEGWQQVRFPVPPGTQFPLELTAIRFMEVRADATYTDHLEIADLQAQIPADVEMPPTEYVQDPVIMTQGTVDGRDQRIAVMSDSQFVAREPDSDLVAAARRTLQEIVAAEPDLLVINGDFVDEAAPEDFALARKILDEEVGDALPYVYVPGNHEVMGGPISNFIDEFGDTTTQQDLGRTRLITLDSSSGTLHPDGSTEQLQQLEAQLRDAKRDRSITGVVVFDHHPIDDPHPDKASQLTDRHEAAALDRVLSSFADSGKSVAIINGHVGTFHATAGNGVSRVINGNSGKGPSGAPNRGGFTGWSMVGIEPREGLVRTPAKTGDRLDWLRVETHARVDSLAVDVPATLQVGTEAQASATLTQDEDREVPVAWPVTSTWGGDRVAVKGGAETSKDRRAVVSYDPTTGTVKGLRKGTATLSVTVNGVTEEAEITVR